MVDSINFFAKKVTRCSLPVVLLLMANACREMPQDKLFSLLQAHETGINFSNELKEDSVFNIIEYLYFYNGGGVAAGDINNDGLIDLYFSSNQNPNKLYLNKGNWKFEDITEKSNTQGFGNWKTGVTMADVNGDGLLDIYSCGVGNYKKFNSKNQLFINNGDLTFTEKSEEYGLAFAGLSTQAAFFDFDLDGDLDCYLLNHSVHNTRSLGTSKERQKVDSLAGDRLYRNNLISNGVNTGKSVFVDISRDAGIFSSRLGYGLGISTSDFNMDGYPDLYISNDFQENDYLYLNTRNGKFKQVLEQSMGHSSRFSMGNDAADINNDLRPDLISLDMLPRDEGVIKTSAGDDPYEIYKFKLSSGFYFQTARNCLQLNQLITDSSVYFSDIAIAAGVEATDWSWSPLLADFDNDGYKDLFISNGILRRPNDMDYISFISNQSIQDNLKNGNKYDLDIVRQMPEGKISNFIFRNTGRLKFEDKTNAWGINRPSFSNGAAYADLDNDGDLDLIVNNLNEGAFVYKNNSTGNSFLKIIPKGFAGNNFGLGLKVIAYAGAEHFYYEINSTRSFCSAVDIRPNLGFGKYTVLDSLKVIWPGGKMQKLTKVALNKALPVTQREAHENFSFHDFLNLNSMFHQVEDVHLPKFRHRENNYNAFNQENLMPQMLSTEGPAMDVADLNGDGLDDVFVGGGKGQPSELFLQKGSGEFNSVNKKLFEEIKEGEVVDAIFFDADRDGDKDLMVIFGGQESFDKTLLQPRLYINNGAGSFAQKNNNGLDRIYLNASCVKPNDFDLDGDVDLFIGASTMPLLYGMSPLSFLLVNDGNGNFQPLMSWLGNSQFSNLPHDRTGMVKDAAWADVNKDGLPDLVLVGEWMPITILIQQKNHTFLNQTQAWGLAKTNGMWNTIAEGDFDGDGDIDFAAGNLGLNSRLKASETKPLKMILGDLDGNGSSDHIIVYFNGERSYPFASRDQLVKQLPYLKKKFLKYKDYRDVKVEDIVSPALRNQTTELQIEELQSLILLNNSNGFLIKPMPVEAQLSPIEVIYADDLNNDGFLDLLLAGNLSAVQTELGPYDASMGLVLTGNGKGDFNPVQPMRSGFIVKGEARGIKSVKTLKNERFYLVSRNNDSLLGFKK